MIPKAQSIKEQLDFIKIKSFCYAKDLNRKTSHTWDKLLANHIETENWFPDYINNSQNLTITKQPNKKMGKRVKQTCHQRKHRDGKYMKNAQHLWSLGKCKSEP